MISSDSPAIGQASADAMEMRMSDIEGGEIAVQETGEVVLLVKTGLREERRVSLKHGDRIGAIVEVIARERDVTVEEMVIVCEGEVAELTLDSSVSPDYPHKRRHHVHHRSLVKVIVFYGAKEAAHEFKRRETVDEVFDWAVALKEFGIDPAMQGEFVLVLHGQKDEVPGSEHIGHLAGHAKELKLDLVRGDIANG